MRMHGVQPAPISILLLLLVLLFFFYNSFLDFVSAVEIKLTRRGLIRYNSYTYTVTHRSYVNVWTGNHNKTLL